MERKPCPPSCVDCAVAACRRNQEDRYPEFCLTKNMDPEILAGYSEGYESTVAQWNTRSVCFGEDGMTVTFSEYELGPYALGTQTFTIQYGECMDALGQGGQVKLGLAEPAETELDT